MKRNFKIALGVLVLVLAGALPVRGIVVVTEYVPGCGSFSASGTNSSPYTVVEIYDPNIGADLYFAALPTNSDGTFDLQVNFTLAAGGTTLEMWVWGSPTSDPEDWDGEEYFFTEEPCIAQSIVEIPTLQGGGAILFGLLLATAAVFWMRRRTAARDPFAR